MENMRSTAAEEACTPKYFIASVSRLGKTTCCCFQKASVDIVEFDLAVLI